MSELIKTAPEKIYLCVSDCESSRDESFPEYHGEVTWADHQAVSVTVEYVRSDLAIINWTAKIYKRAIEIMSEQNQDYANRAVATAVREMLGEA